MAPDRRTVLATLSSALVSAGCLGTNPGSPDDGTTTPTDRPGDTPTDTPTDGPSDTPTDNAPQLPTDSRFAGEPCPTFTDADRTVCWHTATDPDVFLAPETEVFRPVSGNQEVETVTFTLHNVADEPFALNPYAWALKRREDGDWRHVAPDAHIEPLVEVPPGGSYEWVLSRQQHPVPPADDDERLYPTVDVSNGHYAFVVDGWFGEGDESQRESVACVALFDVRGVHVDPGENSTT
ncbi:MAG: hypothetical protein ABEJ30_00015 [Halorientalis sp.]